MTGLFTEKLLALLSSLLKMKHIMDKIRLSFKEKQTLCHSYSPLATRVISQVRSRAEDEYD